MPKRLLHIENGETKEDYNSTYYYVAENQFSIPWKLEQIKCKPSDTYREFLNFISFMWIIAITNFFPRYTFNTQLRDIVVPFENATIIDKNKAFKEIIKETLLYNLPNVDLFVFEENEEYITYLKEAQKISNILLSNYEKYINLNQTERLNFSEDFPINKKEYYKLLKPISTNVNKFDLLDI